MAFTQDSNVYVSVLRRLMFLILTVSYASLLYGK